MLLIADSNQANAAEDHYLPLRAQNPFLQIYGLPKFQSAELSSKNQTQTGFSLDIANHSDSGVAGNESTIIDGETYYLGFSWRYGWTDRLELGVDVPIVSHNKGFLDGTIENWHDLFGLSNTNRKGQRNRLLFGYTQPGMPGYSLDSSGTALGDIQLSAAFALDQSGDGGRITLRSSLKLPSGDDSKLTGSGAADFSLGIYATDNTLFTRDDLSASAFAGVLLLGNGKVLSHIQKDSVGFAGVSTAWQINSRFAVNAQLYSHSAFYDSRLDEIGGNSTQFAAGGTFQPRNSRVAISLGVVEDLFSNATTDVAFHFSIRVKGTRPTSN